MAGSNLTQNGQSCSVRSHPHASASHEEQGDLGVLYAEVDLAEKGYRLLLPLSEHEPFDLVAYQGTTFLRVSVKYRAAVRGAIIVPFKSSWADRHGTHVVPIDKRAVDVVCVYCPDTRCCYYVDPLQFGGAVMLRIEHPKNNIAKGVHRAKDFTEIPERLRKDP